MPACSSGSECLMCVFECLFFRVSLDKPSLNKVFSNLPSYLNKYDLMFVMINVVWIASDADGGREHRSCNIPLLVMSCDVSLSPCPGFYPICGYLLNIILIISDKQGELKMNTLLNAPYDQRRTFRVIFSRELRIYERVCPLVGRSFGRSVTLLSAGREKKASG